MLSNIQSFAALAVAIAYSALASTYKSGTTVNVDGTYFYIPASPISSLGLGQDQLSSACSPGDDYIPLTVMTGDFNTFDATTLQSTVTSYLGGDDVFNTGFLQATTSCTSELPAGPYFLHAYTGDVFQAYRLYSDYEGAFTEGTIANADGNFSTMSASIPGVQSPTIGVPSRLYYAKSDAQPLAGVRLGVKDIYDVAGTRRGCGNRAYYDLYPERPTTAPAVQRLLDAGAVLVGKMKTSQFANGEMATADWVDYHSPFNARGDGYNDPSSSSSGPGAGIGAYDWLDLGLGSDTGGSIRNPAQVNGAFGNRPSHGLVTLDNVMPLSPLMDTAGFITRDASLWKTTGHVLYSNNLFTFTSFPKKLYTSTFPTNITSEADAVILDFLSKLETFLGVNASVLDYDSMWASSPEAASTNASTLSDLLTLTYPTLIGKQQYTLFGAPFIADYQAAHDGRQPFLDPNPLVRWTWAQTNATTLEEGINNKTIFMDWWNSEVIKSDPETCSDSLLLYPGTLATPNPRNVYLSPPVIPAGWSIQNVAIMAGVPDMVLPVGQAPYNSTISLHEEYLPVAVDIIAAPGCDAVIFELAEQLQNAGIINAPKAGSTMYRREVSARLE
ncbi:putative Glutamyl-tRNA amidotransferase subunit A [Mollisia scopiformis]|uniref:Putative Glutamyl-tRNA amidotransferase subunit A n=1 Tax=Mollisia scopiformis TaxID=149040 RepID=A0A194X2Z8_MOLSC|nr:putative Glutamyl-tRNA amidotransferase subunit A [Mollisia scopiformis]KUJ14563.1 putative Glutamyl-tRNA amidotransferase subunit A [Mollisia scopiformis]